MERRKFLQATLAVPALAVMPSAVRETIAAQAAEGWRTFETVTKVEITNPTGVSRAWVPLPFTEKSDWHNAMGNKWTGNGQMKVVNDGKYGAQMVYAEWKESEKAPVLEVTRGAKTDVEKAYAIYEWIVDNTFRDPKTRGCGWGDIKTMLETRNFGGKCGDLNAMFVGMARSVGIPARDIYGLRVAPSQFGYRSMSLGTPNATRAQHCRAEFYAQGIGWVPVDPADVRKVVLEEPPGNLAIKDPKVLAARKKLFGAWEMNWLAYNTAHDVKLPHSTGPKIPYLMYVNGEKGGKVLDQLDPDPFKYTITAQEIKV